MRDVADGATLLGQAAGEAVLVARRGNEIFAIGATCTHYSGPLAEGVFVGDEVRCPWHHACFSVRTGEAVAAPALNPVDCWKVDRDGDRFFVREKLVRSPKHNPPSSPSSVVIVGAGAAGHAAAEMLRREGYAGPVTLIGSDLSVPYDRPNVSKDYLAGTAPEEWIPLRPAEYYARTRSIARGHDGFVRGCTCEACDLVRRREHRVRSALVGDGRRPGEVVLAWSRPTTDTN